MMLVCLVGILILGNVFWFSRYQEQRKRVKNSLIPTLSNDYYSNQLMLTKSAQKYNYSEMGAPFFEVTKKTEIYDVPLVEQMPKFPGGCEAASAVMALQFYGIDVTLEEFMEYLPKEEVITRDGTRFGPNPAEVYAGNPSDKANGWGCFDRVIVQSLEKILISKPVPFTMQIMNVKRPLNELERLSIIWVTTDYEEVKEIFTWQSLDGKETYTMPRKMHVVVLTGEDENYYYINDPLKLEKNIPVLKSKLEASFDSMGRQYLTFNYIEVDKMLEIYN